MAITHRFYAIVRRFPECIAGVSLLTIYRLRCYCAGLKMMTEKNGCHEINH